LPPRCHRCHHRRHRRCRCCPPPPPPSRIQPFSLITNILSTTWILFKTHLWRLACLVLLRIQIRIVSVPAVLCTLSYSVIPGVVSKLPLSPRCMTFE
jgi:hypothetical protein